MIEIDNISMHYGPTVALDKVSFTVDRNKILGLLGPNGAGKSTLMRILTTFIYPTQGTAKLGGYDILENPLQVREKVGYMPENVPLYMDMRVDEYLAFVGQARGIKGPVLKKRFDWIKTACGIVSVWKHDMGEISKGFRQRVGLAQALIHDPEVLILDEPTTGLDPLQIIGIRSLIKDLARDKTIIFSTHILQQVEALADKTVIINEGKIVAQGSKEELARQAMKYRTYVLKVKGERHGLETALSGIPSAKDVALAGESANNVLTFEIKGAFDGPNLWKEVDELKNRNNLDIRAFSERIYSMEDIFISLLKKGVS